MTCKPYLYVIEQIVLIFELQTTKSEIQYNLTYKVLTTIILTFT